MHPDIYPVGALASLLMIRRAVRDRRWSIVKHYIQRERQTLRRYRRNREWQNLKNHFNGYLCEPTPFPVGVTRCGSGWTKRRAARSMDRQILKAEARWTAGR